MSGHRHAANPAGRRGRGVLVAGGVAVLVAVACVAAASLALRSGRGHPQASGSPKGAAAEDSPMNALQGSERDAVPDACEALSPGIAGNLVPGADRSVVSHAAQADQHTECAWSLFGSTRSRQLTVELRAIQADGGISATNAAVRTFRDEWQSDRSGKDLADTARVKDSRSVTGVGEQAYVVYTIDGNDEIGEAVANARLSNVLITVRYSGGNDRTTTGTPLSAAAATGGALSATRDIVSKLESHS